MIVIHLYGGRMRSEMMGDTYARHRRGTQFDTTGDTIPVTLCLVGHTMGVLSYTDILDAVIYKDSNLVVFPCLEVRRDIILVRRGE